MDFTVLPHHTLRAVVWLSIAMLVLAALLVLHIVWLRVRLKGQRRREHHFRVTWQPVMEAVAAGGSVAWPPLAGEQKLCFLKLWNGMQESRSRVEKMRLNALAEGCDVLPYAQALLGRTRLHPRLIALMALGYMGDRTPWNDIVRLSREPDALLSLAAARAMFQIDAEGALHELMPQLLQRDDWQTAQLAVLIKEHGTDNLFAYLADATARLSGSSEPPYLPQLRRLLRLLEAAPARFALPAVRRVLTETEDDEVVASCLKFLRSAADLPAVRSRVGHSSWIVRLQAARALGRIGSVEDIPALTSLLGDSAWWVRYRSAQALVALMRDDTEALSQVRSMLADRYGRDMLDMVLAEEASQ